MSRVRTRLPVDGERLRLLRSAVVAPVGARCIQCGICVRNCPMGIDVRRYARMDRPVTDVRCLLCGSCVVRCPRANLRFVYTEPPR